MQEEGCTRCRLQPFQWQEFIDSLSKISEIQTILIVESDSAKFSGMDLPIYFDPEKMFSSQNHLPDDERLHCFLLDSANRVILIGNPVQFPKIKDLYIRAICDRLGIEHPAAGKDSQQPSDYHDFGNFPFSEAKETEFAFRNESETQIKIDTVFTSCDCTTAIIDRMSIEPGGLATVKVRFKTDHPEQFMREIYVQYGGQTRVFTIRGTAE